MKTVVWMCVALAALAVAAGAQSNEVIDEILDRDAATFGQAAYVVFLAAEEAPEDASVEEVHRGISWSDWNLDQKPADEPVRLGEFSYLLMESFDIPGGIMYRLIPGPRYAARELDYLDFLLRRGDPSRVVSGQEMLHAVGQALRYAEERS
ncbi:MAG: hypothetical protein ACLFUX_07980 [Spirochaetaceae bacterium]